MPSPDPSPFPSLVPSTGFGDVCRSETGVCYLKGAEMSWSDCQTSCEGMGASMVCIDSAETDSWVYSNVVGEADAGWIGLSDTAQEGVWTWVDGCDSTYTFWGNGEPNNNGPNNGPEDCVSMGYHKPEGKWNDTPCAGISGYSYCLCEK